MSTETTHADIDSDLDHKETEPAHPRGYLKPEELPEIDTDDIQQQEQELIEKIARDGFL